MKLSVFNPPSPQNINHPVSRCGEDVPIHEITAQQISGVLGTQINFSYQYLCKVTREHSLRDRLSRVTFLIPLPFPLSLSPGWTVSFYLHRKQYHASLRTSSWHEYKMSSRSSHHHITGENVSTKALRNGVVAVTIRQRCLKQQQSSFPEVNSPKLTHYFQIWQQFIWRVNVIEQAIIKQALPASVYPLPPWVWPPWHP